MNLVFINAHPDDTEFTSASTCKQAIDLGWDVTQILMTSDEYGTARNDFKGKRIRQIRQHEMREAAKVYGINSDGTSKLNIIWFGEIDANLPFNRDVFLRLKKLLENLKPDIVIGPDSFFSFDLHPDHKHTGWLIYLIIKSIKPADRPMLLLYHSCNTNFYIPIKDFRIQVDAWSKHRSQASPIFNKIILPLRKIFYFLKRIKTGPIPAEGFRKVSFTKGENELKKLRHKIIYLFEMRMFKDFSEKLCHPTPKELGLIDFIR